MGEYLSQPNKEKKSSSGKNNFWLKIIVLNSIHKLNFYQILFENNINIYFHIISFFFVKIKIQSKKYRLRIILLNHKLYFYCNNEVFF